LIVRKLNRDFELKPLMFGGEQEKKLRPGTLNVAGIVGLGEACALGMQDVAEECSRLHALQSKVLKAVRSQFPQVKLNGFEENRLCNNLSFSFPNMHADDMALELSGLAYSSGSACNSSNPKPSHVLTAMGVPEAMARATLRLGMGRFTTEEEVSVVLDKLLKMLGKVYAGK
jgi:cysteine desulfurase